MRKSTLILLLTVFCYPAFSFSVLLHSEDFEDCTMVSWQNVSSVNDNDVNDFWMCDSGSGTMEVSGFGGGSDEDWLVSPMIDMNLLTKEFLLFEYRNNFSGTDIELYYSTDFSGLYTSADLNTATWDTIHLDLYDISGDTYVSNFLPHIAIDLNDIDEDEVYFAFRYIATGNSGESETWSLDNIRIEGDYYKAVNPILECEDLKDALHDLIKGHTVINYTGSDLDVWDSQYVTDRRYNDDSTAFIVRDRYSDNPVGAEPYVYTFGVDRDQGNPTSTEGSYYNREHVFPVSWWGGGNTSFVDTQYTDIHMIIPSDKFVNQSRLSYPMAEVASTTLSFMNGGQLGTSPSAAYNGTVFEPIDEYKGDMARIYFYTAVRYQSQIAGWETLSSNGDAVLNGDPYTVYEDWFLNQMMEWHLADTVSDVEKARNNAIYAIQGNRNPFVDEPDYATHIWAAACSALPVEWSEFTAKKKGSTVLLNWETQSEWNNDYFAIQHSIDGKHFEDLAAVNSKGNLNGKNQYSYPHIQPSQGLNYYRLKQVDLDGKSTFSVIRTVDFENDNAFHIYPNPAGETLYFQQNTSASGELIIRNYSGQILLQQNYSEQTTELSLRNLPKGIYLLELVGKGSTVFVRR